MKKRHDAAGLTQKRALVPERRGEWSKHDDEDTPGKRDQRDRILRHLLDHQQPGRQLRLLSMPGRTWAFEHLLLKEWEYASFVGIEWDWSTMEQGAPFMPRKKGEGTHRYTIPLGAGDLHGYETSLARWIHTPASSFVRISRKVLKHSPHVHSNDYTKAHCRQFSADFKGNTAIWLDFTSQMCTEIETALPRLGGFALKGMEDVPVAVSMMMARDGLGDEKDPVGPRAIRLVELLNSSRFRRFIPKDAWSYMGSGAPMITVTGLYRIVDTPRFVQTAPASPRPTVQGGHRRMTAAGTDEDYWGPDEDLRDWAASIGNAGGWFEPELSLDGTPIYQSVLTVEQVLRSVPTWFVGTGGKSVVIQAADGDVAIVLEDWLECYTRALRDEALDAGYDCVWDYPGGEQYARNTAREMRDERQRKLGPDWTLMLDLPYHDRATRFAWVRPKAGSVSGMRNPRMTTAGPRPEPEWVSWEAYWRRFLPDPGAEHGALRSTACMSRRALRDHHKRQEAEFNAWTAGYDEVRAEYLRKIEAREIRDPSFTDLPTDETREEKIERLRLDARQMLEAADHIDRENREQGFYQSQADKAALFRRLAKKRLERADMLEGKGGTTGSPEPKRVYRATKDRRTAYHGSPTLTPKEGLEKGLRPRGTDPGNHGTQGASRPECVYLTSDWSLARDYATHLTGRGTVFEVEVPVDHLGLDEDEVRFAWDGGYGPEIEEAVRAAWMEAGGGLHETTRWLEVEYPEVVAHILASAPVFCSLHPISPENIKRAQPVGSEDDEGVSDTFPLRATGGRQPHKALPVGTPRAYEEILASLESPRRQRWPAPVAPTNEPGWPTPASGQLQRTLTRFEPLTYLARVHCTYLAAEMVVPIIAEGTAPQDTQLGVVVTILEGVRRWLDGGLWEGGPTIRPPQDRAAADAVFASFFLRDALDHLQGVVPASPDAEELIDGRGEAGDSLARAIRRAERAWSLARGSRFYPLWWTRCRNVLAFKDAPSASLQP